MFQGDPFPSFDQLWIGSGGKIKFKLVAANLKSGNFGETPGQELRNFQALGWTQFFLGVIRERGLRVLAKETLSILGEINFGFKPR